MTTEFIYPLRIQFEDTDCTGIVLHSNYLNFMERARSEWIDQLGMGIEWQRENQVVIVIHSVEIKYMIPAKVHDRVEVVSRVKERRHASIVFDQYLRLAGTPDKIFCRAQIKVACVDPNLRPRPLPDAITF